MSIARPWSGISERIKGRRKRLGLSQQALAERAGVAIRVVAKYEAERELPPSGPSLDVVEGIARALEVTDRWLLYGEEDARVEVEIDFSPPTLPDAFLAQLAALGVVPTPSEVRWLANAPEFKDMGPAGAFQALMGNRHGRVLSAAQLAAARQADEQHLDPEIPRRRK